MKTLADGEYDVPPGRIAAVVTHLQMTTAPDLSPVPAPEGVRFARVTEPDPAFYRDLFVRVGAQDWLWTSRLELDDTALRAVLVDPEVELYTLWRGSQAEAMLELDFRESGACELAFFGVTRALIGTGAGHYLMGQALRLAWARDITRFHLHTCTLDSPAALPFYRRQGFTPYRQEIEIYADPRLSGEIPAQYGPHVPTFPDAGQTQA